MNPQGHSRRPPRRYAEKGLFIAALLLLGYWATIFISIRVFHVLGSRRLDDLIRTAGEAAGPAGKVSPGDGVIGKIEIPRLDVSALIAEGTDRATLRLSVGHVAGTPLPGSPGNAGLAGHRDSFFRPLKDIREGDTLYVVVPHGQYQYVVDWTQVASPDRTDLLESRCIPELTLVTCYPFGYIGPAPRRFLVRAREVDRQAAARPDRFAARLAVIPAVGSADR